MQIDFDTQTSKISSGPGDFPTLQENDFPGTDPHRGQPRVASLAGHLVAIEYTTILQQKRV